MKLEGKEQKKLLSRIDFLFNYELFDSWSYGEIKKLYYHMIVKKYKRKQVVYRQNEEADGLYFIKEGEFQVFI